MSIVDNGQVGWAEGDAWRLGETPSVTVGGPIGDPDNQLWQVKGATRLSDGTIVVLNGGTSELRFYDAQGSHLRTRGGQGGGPGEFTRPVTTMAKGQGDSLLVLEATTLHVFDAAGDFVRSRTVTRRLPGSQTPANVSPIAILPNGAIAMLLSHTPDLPPSGTPFRVPTGVALLPSGVDALVVLPYRGGGILQEQVEIGGLSRSFVPPFAPQTVVAAGGPNSRVVVGDNALYQLQVYDHAGRLIQIIRRATQSRRVKGTWLEAWKDQQRSMAWTRNQLPELERAWMVMHMPENLPAYDGVSIDGDGNIWVFGPSAPGDPRLACAVFSGDGRLLGTLSVPAGMEHGLFLRPYIDAAFFVGVWRDGEGRETVRAYEIMKAE